MGWFGFGGQYDEYDRDGNVQRTTISNEKLVGSVGTTDLDYLFKAYAPEFVSKQDRLLKGMNATYGKILELMEIIEKQNQRIEALENKIAVISQTEYEK